MQYDIKALRMKYRKSYSMAERDKARKVQDKLLKLAAVRQFIETQGENKPLWEGGPSPAQMRLMIYPQWIYRIEQLIQELK